MSVAFPLLSSRTRALAAAALLAVVAAPAAARGREEVSRSFQKSVALPAGRRVSIDHSHGNLTVTSRKEPTVSINATIHVSSSSKDAAEGMSRDIRIEVEETEGGLSVRTVYPERRGGFLGFGSLSFSVDYEIVMPELCPLSVHNRFGDVSVSGLRAGGDIANSNGKLVLRDGAGSLRLENSFGSIELAGSAGDASVVNANGSVTASNIGGELEIRNRFGRTGITKVGRRCVVASSNGDVIL
ncbi:MAG TPA: hypothetical protein VEG84_11590 [Thermoanaerobaculia bacterium]|nr:hypothetical protein [Thermoanaerobaculia bacterium]